MLNGLACADALHAAGCIRRDVDTGMWGVGEEKGDELQASITSIGLLVLRVLNGYLRVRRELVPFAIPGHEVPPASRLASDAAAMIHQAGQLAELVVEQGRLERDIRYLAPKRVRPSGALPPHDAIALLTVGGLTEQEARAIAGVAPPSSPAALDAIDVNLDVTHRPVTSIETELRYIGEQWIARVVGPHDVLRHLADEADARWI